MKTPDKFWDNVAAKYAKSPIKDVEAYENTLKNTQKHLSKTDKVLELGCGTGGTAITLSKFVKHIAATDISGEMIAFAQEKVEVEGLKNISCLKATAESAELRQKKFNKVLAFNFLHLVPNLAETLEHIHELTADDGLFISKTVCLKEMSPLVSLIIPIMQLFGLAPFVAKLSPKDLKNAISKAGFEILETANYPEKPARPFIVARKI